MLRASPFPDVQRPGNPSRNSGATAEGTSKALQLLNKTRICVHFLGGKYNHMWLKPSHHLVCADMNPLGRVSIWLGKRFPSPSPPHLPSFSINILQMLEQAADGLLSHMECWPGERCRSTFWPPATLGYNGPPTLSYLRIKPLAACCQVLSACSTNLV